MDINEATTVIWQALSCYCEDSISSDDAALEEIETAWKILLQNQ